MRSIWAIISEKDSIILCLNKDDNFCLKINGEIRATYNEKTQEWIGFKEGKVHRIKWANLRTIASEFQ